MTSQRKADSNRRNAQLSTGPRTPIGKNNMRWNALKDGFFAKALHFSENDHDDFDALKGGLWEQFDPRTPLQRLAAEKIVCSAWRVRLALRLESRYVAREESNSSQNIPAPETPTITEWYGSNARATRTALELLNWLIEEVHRSGCVPSDAEEATKRAFGQKFYDELVAWDTSQMWALRTVEHWKQKREMFGLPDPLDEDRLPEVVRDPRREAQMKSKILELKRDQLIEMQHILNQNAATRYGPAIMEPPHRYVTSAFKELIRAIDFYQRLVKEGL
jgi:hypothetical protein